jgi:predicted Zn-dependent protease
MKINTRILRDFPRPSTKLDQSIRGGLRACCLLVLATVGIFAGGGQAAAQNNFAIWGEVKITGGSTDAAAPTGATIVLNKVGTGEIARQNVSSGGRYRFTNLQTGDYDIGVEVDGRELTRSRLTILPGALSPFYGFRQDFEFSWKPGTTTSRAGVVSAADAYSRSSANQALFQKAQEAMARKKYEQATDHLKQIIENDKADFQVLSLLGTLYLMQEKPAEAEKSYLAAIEAKPTFTVALMNLARMLASQKRFEEAIDPLTRTLALQPESAEANLLMGEAYLQVKKGSKAIGYLNEAARLGKPEAHLRLGWLYNAAGMKDKAAHEYDEFLRKKPDYPDRKKLEEYIAATKKT